MSPCQLSHTYQQVILTKIFLCTSLKRNLTLKKKFDCLVIKSTGISELLQVADTFTFEDNVSLSEFAQLDTMVTVVDCNVFFENLDNIQTLAERKEGLGEED